MSFFDNLATMILGWISSLWALMKSIAGTIINSTFGWYTGQPIEEDIAAMFVYGGLFAILCVYLFFRGALKFK